MSNFSPPDWNGDLNVLIEFFLNSQRSFQDKAVVQNFIPYGAILYSLLWKERNIAIHEGIKKDLSCSRQLVDKHYLEFQYISYADNLYDDSDENDLFNSSNASCPAVPASVSIGQNPVDSCTHTASGSWTGRDGGAMEDRGEPIHVYTDAAWTAAGVSFSGDCVSS